MIWEHTEGFSQKEKWGKPHSVNGLLLLLLTALRKEFRMFDPSASFVIHNAYDTSGHTPNSQHYKGNAADFHIITTMSYKGQVTVMRTFLASLQVSDRVGFGIYPQWNNKGFHLDVRGEPKRWGHIDGKYVSLEKALEKA
jgi:uncharacterized protein YcbK (DUF882 family)